MTDATLPSKERNILDLAKNLQDELHVYCKGAAGSGDNFYARTFANLADRADELVKLLESAPETGACGCPEVCKVCGGRANSCALLGHRPEADRSVKWHECKANAQKAVDQRAIDANALADAHRMYEAEHDHPFSESEEDQRG